MATGRDGASLGVMEGNGTGPYWPLRVSHKKSGLRGWETAYSYNRMSVPGGMRSIRIGRPLQSPRIYFTGGIGVSNTAISAPIATSVV